MTEENSSLKRKLAKAGGWTIAKRVAKSIPYVGTVMAIGLVGYDIKRKGVVKGVLNSGLDAIPFVGLGKNVVEFFTGDIFPDKTVNGKKMKNKFTYSSLLTAILLGVFVLVTDADAQTRRRKKTVKPPVVSTARTVPIDAGRNDQYLDGNQIVLGEITQPDEPTSQAVSPPSVATNDENNSEVDARIKELNVRIKSLESGSRNEYDDKQKRLLLNLDILSRAETRAESLRKQLFEIVEKEASVRTRLEQISFDARPEMIERSSAFAGSLRPEEIRDQRKKSLDAEKRNLESLLTQIQTSRASLEENVQKADFLVEKVRFKLDKEIDAALADDKENQ